MQRSAEVRGFTINIDGRAKEIITDCGISMPYIPGKTLGNHPQITKTKGLWDTGATHSVITKTVAEKLGLKPIRTAESHHAGGRSIVNVYLVNIYLPHNVAMAFVQVTECVDTIGRFGIIIGMDLITQGDFAISNHDNRTTFSFRMPSVKSINLAEDCLPLSSQITTNVDKARTTAPAKPKLGRNDPCYCGSGKKYKHCHGK